MMLKFKSIQRIMTYALVLVLVTAPCIPTFATGPSTGGNATGPSTGGNATGPSTGGSTTKEPSSGGSSSREEEVVEIVNESYDNDYDEEEDSSEVNSIEAIPQTSSVEGTQTTVEGVYIATSVRGTAITTDLDEIASSYNFENGEKPRARIYNMDTKKSYLAATTINWAATAIGAEVGPYVNVELGKMSGGKFSLLSSDGDQITLKFGIPKSFAQTDKTFAVICVRPGGAVSILEDTDVNPDTVTFNTTGGQGAYAIIKY